MSEMEFILYEVVERVAVITLNRPDRRNAQNPQLLRELDGAWDMAAADKDVRVIVLKANGPHFSAGHDISASRDRAIVSEIDIANEGLAALYNWERTHYLGRPRCLHRRRSHVVLALRPHRRGGERPVL